MMIKSAYEQGYQAAYEKLGMRREVADALQRLGPVAQSAFRGAAAKARPSTTSTRPMTAAIASLGTHADAVTEAIDNTMNQSATFSREADRARRMAKQNARTERAFGLPMKLSPELAPAATPFAETSFITNNAHVYSHPGLRVYRDPHPSFNFDAAPDVSRNTMARLPPIGPASAGNDVRNLPAHILQPKIQKALKAPPPQHFAPGETAADHTLDWRPNEVIPEDYYASPASTPVAPAKTWQDMTRRDFPHGTLQQQNQAPKSKP